MADGLELNAGSGGSTLATDDVGGNHYQLVKIAIGALDAAVLAIAGAGNVTTGTLRVTLADDDTNAAAIKAALETAGGLVVNLGANNDVTVTGTVDLGATDNAVFDAIAALLGTIDTDTGNIATSTALLDDVVYVDDADWADGTSKHLLTGGLYQSSPQTVTDGDVAPFNITANGALHVAQQGTVTVDGSGVTQPVSGTVTANLGATDNAVLDDIAAKLATIDADTSALAAAVSTEYQVDVVGALPSGTNAIGKLAANSGVDIGDVDVTSISAGSNLIGNVGVGVRTTGGMSIFKSIDIDETEEEVKATAGQVYSITAFNHTAAPLFLKFYNLTAANTTVGSSTPVLTFTVPGNADSDGAGFVWNNPIGFAFSTAISVAATTAIADADTGAPAGNACSVMIGYA